MYSGGVIYIAKMARYCLILLSGGLDSTACLHYYSSQGFDLKCLFIDYGQAAKDSELESARAITSFYKVDLDILLVDTKQKFSSGEIRGRNAFLIFASLLKYPDLKGIITLGLHDGSPYYDCSKPFIKDINRLVANYTNGEATLDMPFIEWNKKMILDYCKDNRVPINLTYSCEKKNSPPCGKCLSCLDRGKLGC